MWKNFKIHEIFHNNVATSECLNTQILNILPHKLAFSNISLNPEFCSNVKTPIGNLECSTNVASITIISSRCIKTPLINKGLRMLFKSFWKVEGAPFKLKLILLIGKYPLLIIKAVFALLYAFLCNLKIIISVVSVIYDI